MTQQEIMERNEWSAREAMASLGYRADMLNEVGAFTPGNGLRTFRPSQFVSVTDGKDVIVELTTGLVIYERDSEEAVDWLLFAGRISDVMAKARRIDGHNRRYREALNRWHAHEATWGTQLDAQERPAPDFPTWCEEHGKSVCAECTYPF